MKSRKINFTAAMVSMALAIGAFGGTPPSISAASTDDAEVSVADTGTTRNLTVNYMGRGSTPQDTSQGLAKLTATDVNSVFWVSVAVDNVNDLENFTNGIYSLELQFEYDPTYIAPADDWATYVASANVGSGDIQWDSSVYEAVTGTGYDLDTSDRYDSDAEARAAAGWKMAKTCIRVKSGASTDSLRFASLDSSDTQYLVRLPFKLVKMPDLTEDADPKLLRLALGCTQFNIGSGTDGLTPAAEWDPDTDDGTEDTADLSTLFTFGGDISLFTTSSGLTDMTVTNVVDTDEDPDAVATEYPLSQSTELNEEGFANETYTYYVSVPNDTDEIMLTLASSDAPTVKANDAAVTVTAGDAGTYTTAAIKLNELTAGWTDESETFSNTVVVTVGTTAYTVHVRRLLEPTIVLNYGNSPYGEIMKADNIPDKYKDAAKEDFNSGNKFTTNTVTDDDGEYSLCPDGCSTDNKYPINAWGGATDSDTNMDRNDYALFIYNGESFTDPGFTAYDSLGKEFAATGVSRSMTVNIMSGQDVSSMLDAAVAEDSTTINNISGVAAEYEFTQLASVKLRPDIYEMTYTFTDNYGYSCEVVRYVVCVWDVGDVNLSTLIDSSDITSLKRVVKGTTSLDSKYTKQESINIYQYRIADVNLSNVIDSSDITSLKRIVKGTATQDRIYNE